MVRAYADKYVAVMNQALSEMMSRTQDADARALAARRRLGSASSAYSIAAQPNPEVSLLDMAVLVTVEREMIVRGDLQEAFGEDTRLLTDAYDKVDSDIWDLVRRVYSPAQIDELTDAIERWLTANPDLRDATFIRVDDFAKLRAESTLSRVGRPGGLSMLAPINEATRAADDIRLLGERAMFLTQRLPQVIRWQAELLVSTSLGDPRVQGVVGEVRTLSATVADLVSSLNRLPAEVRDEREAIIRETESAIIRQRDGLISAIEGKSETLRVLLEDARAAMRESDALTSRLGAAAESARAAAESADRLVSRFAGGPDGAGGIAASLRPMEEYLRQTERLAVTASHLNEALAAAERLLAQDAGALTRFEKAADERISRIVRGAVIVVIVFFTCLASYRLLSLWAGRRMGSPRPGA